MLTRKCNRCSALLENVPYYEIGSIEFNHPDTQHTRVSFDDKIGESGYKTTESWCRYMDLHFCEICWDSESFKNYLPKLS